MGQSRFTGNKFCHSRFTENKNGQSRVTQIPLRPPLENAAATFWPGQNAVIAVQNVTATFWPG